MRGYSTLTSVMLLLAFLSLIIVGMYTVNINQLLSQSSTRLGSQNLIQAETCIEEVLRRLKDDLNFAGGAIPLGTYNCQAVITGNATQKTVTATVATGDISQSVTVTLDIIANGEANNFRITSWSR